MRKCEHVFYNAETGEPLSSNSTHAKDIICSRRMTSGRDVTTLLALARNGDSEAAAALIELVYPELHRLAASYMRRERPGIAFAQIGPPT